MNLIYFNKMLKVKFLPKTQKTSRSVLIFLSVIRGREHQTCQQAHKQEITDWNFNFISVYLQFKSALKHFSFFTQCSGSVDKLPFSQPEKRETTGFNNCCF